MPILVKPTMACNFRCDYCYQHALHEADWTYDLDQVEAAMRREFERCGKGGQITLHGGEITTLPLADLRRLLSVSFELQGRSSIQTNGWAVPEELIALFSEFKTSIGVSIDGPWPHNKYRGIGSEVDRRRQTETVLANLKRFRDAGLSVSVISVISHLHVEDPEPYWDWVLALRDMGITSGRMNYVQRIEGFEETELPAKKFAAFYVEMAKRVWEEQDLQWQPYRDVVDNLLGLGCGTCSFTKCDPFNTASALVVDGHGELHSCLRSAQDGTALCRVETGDIRYQSLAQTPQKYGGCKGCRYWKVCYGSCPATGLDGDWRNRGEYCEVWKALYAFAERRLLGLMPNLHLVTDDAAEEYEERRGPGLGQRTFAAMIRPHGSTWRQSCRPKQEPQVGGWQKVEGAYADTAGYLKDMGNGYRHADHSDTGRAG